MKEDFKVFLDYIGDGEYAIYATPSKVFLRGSDPKALLASFTSRYKKKNYNLVMSFAVQLIMQLEMKIMNTQ